MRWYSHSKLWLFESCPEAYKAKYVDKIYPEIPISMSLFLGDLVHRSLEELYRNVREGKIIEMDDMIRHFAENWKIEINDKIRIMNGESKDELLNKGIKFLMDYYQRHFPFKENTVELEKKIVFPLDESEQYGITGYIDRLVLNNLGEFEVHDYKTNTFMKKQEEVDKDRQLAFYHLGLKEIYGEDVKVKLVWHFLAHDRSIVSRRDKEQLEQLKRETLKMIKYIEANDFWSACGKRWCDWCAWKKKNDIENYNKKSIIVEREDLGKWM
ncbi:PD-(D/E)XK nuclease family protein [Candidatus Pacearchaeota archaeon]|nr:PD-(D/E)XK nuclease family protein [Candidatus Pacearchaeota archaeon]